MANEIQKRGTGAVTFTAHGEDVTITMEDVKRYLVSGNAAVVSDKEVIMFLQQCRYQGLNPWLKDAYLIKYDAKSPAQIVTSIGALMKRANAQDDFLRYEAGIIVLRDDEVVELTGSFMLPSDNLVGGWAKVYKKGIDEPTESKVSVTEYGKGQSTWKSMPATMIRKVALSRAITEAYPDQFSGIYLEEEIQKEEQPEELGKAKPTKRPERPYKAIRQDLPVMATNYTNEEEKTLENDVEAFQGDIGDSIPEEIDQGSFFEPDFEPVNE